MAAPSQHVAMLASNTIDTRQASPPPGQRMAVGSLVVNGCHSALQTGKAMRAVMIHPTQVKQLPVGPFMPDGSGPTIRCPGSEVPPAAVSMKQLEERLELERASMASSVRDLCMEQNQDLESTLVEKIKEIVTIATVNQVHAARIDMELDKLRALPSRVVDLEKLLARAPSGVAPRGLGAESDGTTEPEEEFTAGGISRRVSPEEPTVAQVKIAEADNALKLEELKYELGQLQVSLAALQTDVRRLAARTEQTAEAGCSSASAALPLLEPQLQKLQERVLSLETGLRETLQARGPEPWAVDAEVQRLDSRLREVSEEGSRTVAAVRSEHAVQHDQFELRLREAAEAVDVKLCEAVATVRGELGETMLEAQRGWTGALVSKLREAIEAEQAERQALDERMREAADASRRDGDTMRTELEAQQLLFSRFREAVEASQRDGAALRGELEAIDLKHTEAADAAQRSSQTLRSELEALDARHREAAEASQRTRDALRSELEAVAKAVDSRLMAAPECSGQATPDNSAASGEALRSELGAAVREAIQSEKFVKASQLDAVKNDMREALDMECGERLVILEEFKGKLREVAESERSERDAQIGELSALVQSADERLRELGERVVGTDELKDGLQSVVEKMSDMEAAVAALVLEGQLVSASPSYNPSLDNSTSRKPRHIGTWSYASLPPAKAEDANSGGPESPVVSGQGALPGV